jgi:hypothetical protein
MLEHPTARDGVHTDCQVKTKWIGKRLPLTRSALSAPVEDEPKPNAERKHGSVPTGQLINPIPALNCGDPTVGLQRKPKVAEMPLAAEHSPVIPLLPKLSPGIETVVPVL